MSGIKKNIIPSQTPRAIELRRKRLKKKIDKVLEENPGIMCVEELLDVMELEATDPLFDGTWDMIERRLSRHINMLKVTCKNNLYNKKTEAAMNLFLRFIVNDAELARLRNNDNYVTLQTNKTPTINVNITNPNIKDEIDKL